MAVGELWNPRLQGCRAFGELSGSAELAEDRAVVERHQEQAAEVVPIPLLWRGARQGGVVKGWPVLPHARIRLPHLLSFPLRGHGVSKTTGFQPALE